MVLSGGNPACAAVASAATSFVTGVTSGSLGAALRAGLMAGAQAVAFYVVGGFTNVLQDQPFFVDHVSPGFGTSAYGFQVAGHALVGCGFAVASGGKCSAGALAAGVTAAAGPFINGKNFAANVASNAVLGGLASVAGGGKFANGAVTGAFGYLFNNAAGTIAGRLTGQMIGAWVAGILGAETGPADAAIILAGRWIGGTIGAAIGDRLTGPNIVNNDGDANNDEESKDDKIRESAPTDKPSGVRPIDKWGIPTDEIHGIKKEIGAGNDDWVGISKDGDVYTTGSDGKAVWEGHVDDFTKRNLKQFPRPE
jgi:hypothetical protein